MSRSPGHPNSPLPQPAISGLLLQTKALRGIHPWLVLARRLRGPWVALGWPKGHPNPNPNPIPNPSRQRVANCEVARRKIRRASTCHRERPAQPGAERSRLVKATSPPSPSYPSQIGVELSDGHPKSSQIGVGFSDWDSIGVGLTRFQFRAMSCDDAIPAIRRALRAHPPPWLSTRIQRP
jgi:hypothetical protein